MARLLIIRLRMYHLRNPSRLFCQMSNSSNGNEQNTRLQTRDPAVALDADGTVYFVYQAEDRLTEVMSRADKAGDTHPKVAVSHDKGKTWAPSIDVGANVLNGAPIRNATFVTATAGMS